jgi:hypothetical protein
MYKNKKRVIARNEAISMLYRANKPIVERSIAAKAVTLSWYKVTKDQVSRNASLPHKVSTLQTRQNHGLLNLASFALCRCFGKVC